MLLFGSMIASYNVFMYREIKKLFNPILLATYCAVAPHEGVLPEAEVVGSCWKWK